jgi:thiol:disulfide interchange protein DsbC
MKNKLIFILAVLFLLGVVSTGAGEMTKNDDKGIKTKEQILKEFPNLKVTDIAESPIKGLYEVTAGDNIFYWSEEGYVIFGDMFSKDGVSVTAEKRKKIWSTRINRVPLDKAVKIGNGKNVVVEFTDPDCPYCRKVNEYLSKRTDLTRYIFLYPLSQIHKDSANKVAYILSAKDKVFAHDEIYSGKYDKTPTPKQSDVSLKLVEDYISIARTVGIPGTPVLWVNGYFVNGADMQQIAALLDRREEVKKQ